MDKAVLRLHSRLAESTVLIEEEMGQMDCDPGCLERVARA
jgi:hypothetical protein